MADIFSGLFRSYWRCSLPAKFFVKLIIYIYISGVYIYIYIYTVKPFIFACPLFSRVSRLPHYREFKGPLIFPNHINIGLI